MKFAVAVALLIATGPISAQTNELHVGQVTLRVECRVRPWINYSKQGVHVG